MKTASPRNLPLVVIYLFLGLIAVVMFLPFYNIVLVSLATPDAIAAQRVYLLPVSFDFSTYRNMFEGTMIGHAFLVSVGLTILGTAINLLLTVPAGYVLSKKGLPGNRLIIALILFTMLFNGGLIPFYLTVIGLGLKNTIWAMLLPVAVDTFLLIIAINYFRTVPVSLEESARIDGAGDFTILVRIIVPISRPIIATLMLFYAVYRWNEWWYAMMFVNDANLMPLQYVMRQLLIQIDSVINSSAGSAVAQSLRFAYPAGMKMAAIVISTLPIVAVYPLIQRHFDKGILLGSLKE